MALGIQEFFKTFNKDRMDLVEAFYDENAEFIDPLVHFTDRAQLKRYYERLYQNVESIKFEFSQEVVQGQDHMAAWKMTFVAPKFNGGKPVTADGVSHVRFGGKEGKAIYHRDYFDMGEYVYERVPVLSSVIRLVKRVMAGQH